MIYYNQAERPAKLPPCRLYTTQSSVFRHEIQEDYANGIRNLYLKFQSIMDILFENFYSAEYCNFILQCAESEVLNEKMFICAPGSSLFISAYVMPRRDIRP